MTSEEKAEIGVDLIRSGLNLKKEYTGKWVWFKITYSNGINISFTKDPEKNNGFLAHGRRATAPAHETARVLEKEEKPSTGLYVGWYALINNNRNEMNNFYLSRDMDAITKQKRYLICIPKVKPHKTELK
jgi:hypothetical protein